MIRAERAFVTCQVASQPIQVDLYHTSEPSHCSDLLRDYDINLQQIFHAMYLASQIASQGSCVFVPYKFMAAYLLHCLWHFSQTANDDKKLNISY